MFARSGRVLVVVALVLTTGLHWAALQTAAWTTMLAKNLRTEPMSEAVSKTFDGKHLCPLCRAIAAAKQSGKKSEAVSPVLKMEFPLVAEQIILIAPAQFKILAQANVFNGSPFSKPPVPPPRNLPV